MAPPEPSHGASASPLASGLALGSLPRKMRKAQSFHLRMPVAPSLSDSPLPAPNGVANRCQRFLGWRRPGLLFVGKSQERSWVPWSPLLRWRPPTLPETYPEPLVPWVRTRHHSCRRWLPPPEAVGPSPVHPARIQLRAVRRVIRLLSVFERRWSRWNESFNNLLPMLVLVVRHDPLALVRPRHADALEFARRRSSSIVSK